MAFGAFNLATNPGEPAVMSKGSNPGSELSRPLSFGEREALKQQAANRATVGMTPGDHEAAKLRAITVDAALKMARFHGPSR
jgi:hypothetical protein